MSSTLFGKVLQRLVEGAIRELSTAARQLELPPETPARQAVALRKWCLPRPSTTPAQPAGP